MSAAHGEQVRVLDEQVHESGRLNWWGMVFFIASEALIFANLIAGYLYLEIRGQHAWQLPNIVIPAVFTVILLSSSATIIVSERAMRRGDLRQTAIWLTITIVLGTIFLGGQVFEYITLMSEGFTLSTGTFGSSFFLLTGFHGMHVAIGIIFLIVCLIRVLRGHFTSRAHFGFEAGAMYWHFVDVVWIFVFSVVYLVPLLMILGGMTPFPLEH